jgi:uncharacterized protein
MKSRQQAREAEERESRARGRTIRFDCRPGVACFNTCCRDVNIFLSPYDILRMKTRLGIPSQTFLRRHTRTLLPGQGKIPVIQLEMQGGEKRCPFVSPAGCSIYEDRPWACRMYPLDKSEENGEYTFIVEEDRCLGRREPTEWSIGDWFAEQGLPAYEETDERFRIVTQYPRLREAGIDHPEVRRMFWMACYDLDTFRRFVFGTRFLRMFDIEPAVVESIRTDDFVLLELALRWVQYGLVCADVLPLKEEPQKKGGKGKGAGAKAKHPYRPPEGF